MADPVSAIGGAVSIGGSLMQSDAADDAADAQQAAADAATAEQKRQFDINQQNQKPFLQTGTAANQRLAYLLGLNPSSSSSANNSIQVVGVTRDGSGNVNGYKLPGGGIVSQATDPQGFQNISNQAQQSGTVFDPTGWNKNLFFDGSMINSDLAKGAYTANGIASGTPQTDPNNDPAYGSLTKAFGMSDYTADPGYAFRLSEGQKALDRAAASKGGFNSGAAAKALIDYNQNMGSQEYGAAYDRYNTNQTNLYNRLAGVSGTGQTAANTLGQAGQNYANQVSSNLFGAANAQGAGSIAQANAWGTGLNNVAKSFGGNSSSGYNPAASGFFNAGTFNSGAAANGLPWSDIRLKEDIKFIGQENGVPVYTWIYKADKKRKTYKGTIAQEILHTNPDAVHLADNGFYCVDYSKLGVEFREVA